MLTSARFPSPRIVLLLCVSVPGLLSACGAEFKASTTGELGGTTGSGGNGSGAGGASDGGSSSGNGGTSSSGGKPGSGGTPSDGGGTASGGTLGDGGSIGAGGTTDTGGNVGAGGIVVSTGGGVSTGGAVGAGGSVIGTGGVVSNSGGAQTTGGAVGAGGVVSNTGGNTGAGGSPDQCVPGTVLCDKVPPLRCTDQGIWKQSVCGPLVLGDLIGMDATTMPGFFSFQNSFRCKSLSVCGLSQNCLYSGNNLGSLQSGEQLYYDGHTLGVPEAVKVTLAGGAASQCGDPSIDVSAGEYISVKTATGRVIRIFFPKFSGGSFTLYVREDGATFYDAALTILAQPAG